MTAAAEGLDDYSSFLTADQLREVYSQIEGNFVGLGVELKAENGALLIVHVIPGSPAERAGIVAKIASWPSTARAPPSCRPTKPRRCSPVPRERTFG